MTTLFFRFHQFIAIVLLFWAIFHFVKTIRSAQKRPRDGVLPSFQGIGALVSLLIFSGLALSFMVPVWGTDWFWVKTVGSVALFVGGYYFILSSSKPLVWVLGLLGYIYLFGVSNTKSPFLQSEASVLSKQVAQIEQTAPNEQVAIAKIYQALCEKCHGSDGGAGIYEAQDLRKSALDNDMKAYIIKNGKGYMPAHPYLSEEEVRGLVEYVNNLAGK